MSVEKKLIILAGPSGSGKTTIAHHLLNTMPNLQFSISATTRPRRPVEEHGKDYYFMTNEEFKDLIQQDAFVEYEEVYHGTYYGTMKSEMERIWAEDCYPVLDIDVVGAMNIKKYYAPHAMTIFVHPVIVENLQKRLTRRATESEESLEKRIRKAAQELDQSAYFDHVIYNEDLQQSFRKAEQLVEQYLVSDKKLRA